MSVSNSDPSPDKRASSDPPDGITKISDRVHLLSKPIAGPPEIEIVFIHGLRFSEYRDAYWNTWIAGVKDEDGNEFCWPKTWLGKEFPRARIVSLSYDSSAWRTAQQGLTDAYLVGETLVQEMVGIADIGQHENCPVVFVAHSLGGLMVKEIICKAYGKFGKDLKYKKFLQNIGGFLFYATPHLGAKLADTAVNVPNMGETVGLLRVINKELGRLNSEFEGIEKESFAGKWEFAVVAEVCETQFDGFSGKVVEEASARHVYRNIFSVQEDHFGVCKPRDKRSTSYLVLKKFIESLVADNKQKNYNLVELPSLVGMKRLCKVICDKINVEQQKRCSGFCVVGLHGMGGSGKTSICKALCNEFFTDFGGRVCHAELERGSEEGLLRRVLKALTNTSHDRLDKFGEDQLRPLLKEGIKEPVFLALDNFSDSFASIKQAKGYLSAKLPPGSIVMVTARSKKLLSCLRPYLDDSKCLEMPELVREEAKSLFSNSSEFQSRNEADEELISKCVRRCYFQKSEGYKSFHYLPLALDVLGRQLGCIDPEEWEVQLKMIDEDTFNQSREKNHPVYSILRKSFDSLLPEDQLLFMDVMLYLPDHDRSNDPKYNVFKWLGMVHGIPSEDNVKRGLVRLMRRSLLESLGDGINTRVGVHDLWRSFSDTETRHRGLTYSHWVYEAENRSELVDTSLSASCPENVKRMAFIGKNLESTLERVNFSDFSKVTVLKITGFNMTKRVSLNLSGLANLKSLEVSGYYLHRLILEGLPKSLIFLRLNWFDVDSRPSPEQINMEFWESSLRKLPEESKESLKYHHESRISSKQLMKQIRSLEKLQHLQLIDNGGDELPDMKSLISMRMAIFYGCKNVNTVTGLGSIFMNLRVLVLGKCSRLRSCPGVDVLINLEELYCQGCEKLEMLPNLQRLRNLWKLDISDCPLISDVPGLGALVALEEFDGSRCYGSGKLNLPDMRNLRNLRVLLLHGCPVEEVPGLGNLISLQRVEADFRDVVEWPNLRQLTKLQEINILGWSLAGLNGLDTLLMLHTLDIGYCRGVDELPCFRSLISLQTLNIEECEFKDVSGLSNLIALERLHIMQCNQLERIPDLQRLTRLESLMIVDCYRLRGWDARLGQVEVSPSRSDAISGRFDLPDSQRRTSLRTLKFWRCRNLEDLRSIGAFSQLETLDCWDLPALKELPDLSNFPRLDSLNLMGCRSLTKLTSREPMIALTNLQLPSEGRLKTLPDLVMFPALGKLWLHKCNEVTTLHSIAPSTALQQLQIKFCGGLKALPDLNVFPALTELVLDTCSGVTALSCTGPLTSLQQLRIYDCSSLNALPELGLFPALKSVVLKGCSGLTALSCTKSLTALQRLSISDCSGVNSLPDLGMFPRLKFFRLEECSGLSALSSKVALLDLEGFLVRGCRNLSEDDLDHLQELCECEIELDGS